jgi:phosphatidylinositol glycan class S
VLYLSRLNIVPRQEGDRFVLAASDLSLAIHPVESQLASHVSSKPRINFLVYVPPRESSPLHIVDAKGDATAENAFLIPSWGGVVFHNVPASETSAMVDTDKVMEVFLSQLRQLLGLVAHTHLPKGLHLLPLKDEAIRDWERDFLLRRRTSDNLQSSRSTLQSLAGLLEHISNIVIRDEVGQEVVAAVDAFGGAEEALEHASLEKAFANSEKAYIASERAFFDSTLLELLYFPEDQKYAIYIPLFLPVGVPVVLSLRSIFRARSS